MITYSVTTIFIPIAKYGYIIILSGRGPTVWADGMREDWDVTNEKKWKLSKSHGSDRR